MNFKNHQIPTMISEEERRYLYWLTAHIWTGEGHIVEIGPWLGGSTACLAAGMRDNMLNKEKKLHVYDNFIWKKFMKQRCDLPLKEGDSFQEFFMNNVKEYSDLIVAYKESLPDDVIDSDKDLMGKRDMNYERTNLLKWIIKEPVEILFVDGAKSWNGLVYLLDEFAEYLLPGKTLLVCQDYKYWGTYWVPLILELFSEHIELVHNLNSNTVTFKMISAFNSHKLQTIKEFSSISEDSGLECLEKASRRLLSLNDRLGSAILQCGKVRFLEHKGNRKAANKTFQEAEAKWPFGETDTNLELTRKWLEGQISRAISPSIRTRIRRALKII